ncbi:hypothetical protein PGTUg99_031876 [Puccinia graminis f. sp. tritici]|uniref:No apical meristem-associated C-terminal domain-containing protein n=1 Tax=Puccinia graminis f. sp. tritici TaxID=56615 RepID=A0A5B0RPH2_PUCGR|nr:hypothetical protein PGTUg99_031876 [Puccinia graminis f. sp. tritici]
MSVLDTNIQATNKASHPLKVDSDTEKRPKKKNKKTKKAPTIESSLPPKKNIPTAKNDALPAKKKLIPAKKNPKPALRNGASLASTNVTAKKMVSSEGGDVPAEKICPIKQNQPEKKNAPAEIQVEKITPKNKKKNVSKEAATSESDTKPSRAKAYQEDEDVQLCKSWLEVSQDPLNSTNQAANTFWNRITDHFQVAMKDKSRTSVSIKSRWQLLQRRINKFCGCIQQVEQANQSGTSKID